MSIRVELNCQIKNVEILKEVLEEMNYQVEERKDRVLVHSKAGVLLGRSRGLFHFEKSNGTMKLVGDSDDLRRANTSLEQVQSEVMRAYSAKLVTKTLTKKGYSTISNQVDVDGSRTIRLRRF